MLSSENRSPALPYEISAGDAYAEGVAASTNAARHGEPPAAELETGLRETAQPEPAGPGPIQEEIAPAAASVLQPAPEPEPTSRPEPVSPPEPVDDDRPKRSGWWSRRSSFF
jgi:ribonuclease E